MSKSHVGIGHKVCPVCHTRHDEVVLLDRMLRESLERETFMGFELCSEHAKMADEYVALVEADKDGERIGLTGNVCHMKWHVAEQVLNLKGREHPFVWVERGVIDAIQAMVKQGAE